MINTGSIQLFAVMILAYSQLTILFVTMEQSQDICILESIRTNTEAGCYQKGEL